MAIHTVGTPALNVTRSEENSSQMLGASRKGPGKTILMPSIAAVVIGGARVTGGSGIYLGTFAGALFLSTLSTVITALSLSQEFRDLVQGGIILIALLLQSGRLIVRSR